MTNFRQIFENDWCGIEIFLKDVLSPVFGEYEQGYDILTNDSDVREKAKNANITEIRHAATFDFFGSELKVFDITVGDNKKLENNKVGIQAIVRQYINQFEGALIIFHHQKVENQEWRFSYVEKRVNAKDSTSAKRYTYILGKGHPARTIAQRFKDLENKKDKDETILLPALTNAFSVAPLSDDFFNEYREHYANLVEYISGKRFIKKGGKFVEEKTINENGAFKSAFDGDDKLVRDYVKKMMGRLVFLHFLQKKGWLGVPVNAEWGSGDKNFIFNLFKNADENIKSDFLEQALEPLFFNTLNNDRGEDAIAPKAICDIYGCKIRIPYLNGGLFEEDELDAKQVKFKKEHFEKLLDFFNQYNFTIDETDPDDQEIGVDPEMLGKIFENLLEDNKDKGAFYTPKEIVQYMCRESLIAYLEDKTGIDTRNFVINHVNSFNEAQKANVLKALLDVKICDPAVGSGAFPMGMMNELLACTQLLTGETKTRSWLKKHIVKNNIYGVDIEKGAVDIARLRFWLAIIVDEDKPQPLPNLDYKIMQGNSLLECFENIDLSSIANEEVLSGKGKNLLDEYEDPDDAWKEIKNAQLSGFKHDLSEYYDISDHVKKTKLQKDIMDFVKNRIIDKLDFETNNIRNRSIELDAKESTIHSSLKSFSIDSKDPAAIKLRKDLDKIIAEKKKIEEVLLDNQEKQKRVLDLAFNNTEFFLWHTWFGDVFNRPNDCNGFDIVIGNPPYIKEYTNKDAFNGFREYSPYYIGKMDLWYGFACHGIDLLREDGVLCFIAQNNWTTSSGAKLMRKKIIEDSIIRQMLDFNTYMIFENADIQTMVMLFQRNNNFDNYTFDYRTLLENSEKQDMLSLLEKKNTTKTKYLSPKLLRENYNGKLLTFTENDLILDKISNDKIYLTEEEVTQGIIGNPDNAFKINNTDLHIFNSDEKKFIHSFHTHTERYEIDDTDISIIYLSSKEHPDMDINKYPNIKKQLIPFTDELKNRREVLLGRFSWFFLHWPRKEETFKKGFEKIITQVRCEKPKFCYTTDEYYGSRALFFIQTKRWNMKLLLGILNSKLIEFWLRGKGKIQGAVLKLDKEPLLGIPLPKYVPANKEKIIVGLVDTILSEKNKKSNIDISSYEKKIDNLVYEIYGLCEEDINLINK